MEIKLLKKGDDGKEVGLSHSPRLFQSLALDKEVLYNTKHKATHVVGIINSQFNV